MKKDGFIFSFLTGLAVAAFIVFISCATGEKKGETDPLEQEQTVGDNAAGTGSDTELPAEGSEAKNDLASAETPAEQNPEQTSLEESLPNEQELAQKAENPEGDPSLESPPPTEEKLAEPAAPGPAEDLALPGEPTDSKLAAAEPPPAAPLDPLPAAPEASPEPLASSPELPSAELPSDPIPPPRAAMWSGQSKIPAIPESALSKKGASLNRFYFLRKGDTASSVAQLLYGTAQKTDALKKWNAGVWAAGKLVYYSSPSQPGDAKMQSFYKERAIENSSYTVKKGDWLSSIAKKTLGDAKSWKEIAVINGLKSADALVPGQKLAIYPVNLRHTSSPVVKAPEPAPPAPKPQAVAKQEAPSTPPIGSGPPAFQPESPVQFPADASPPEEEKTKKHSLDLSKLVQQNLITIAGGVLLIALLVSLLLVNKRRKARQSEGMDDDAFNAK